MSERQPRLTRADFRVFRAIPTRWHDNDAFGHVNNVVYYGWFDTAVNAWLIENGFLDLASSEIVGLVVETGCTYFESVAFPETVEAGIAVERLGNSSVTYRIGIFRQGGEQALAQGRFTHVYVERADQKPVPIPAPLRAALTAIQS
ncbi:acyl-CoA thioester hydrolase [Bosea sp. AK1]|uniref:acyl-CoA thioesterase n=1 Tax=Bosea sp. AK1 TaxID=2587160 RepID=UPI001152A75E|nr:thioesterase family protein [Bosea sp. AK1]TQI73656.1 acyl-CoA thioester hydrolase [Bosea sp. AK1]